MKRYSRSDRDTKPGRIVVIAIFLLFCAIDLFVYQMTPVEQQREVLSSSIVRLLWTAVLLGAIWYRQNWARYVLIGLLLIGALFFIPITMELIDVGLGVPPFIIVFMLMNIAVIWALIYLPAIRSLTNRQ